jgi:hypothetical protein
MNLQRLAPKAERAEELLKVLANRDRLEGAHPNERRGDSEGLIRKHIVGCMKSAGYTWTSGQANPLPRIPCREALVASNFAIFRAPLSREEPLPVKRRSSDEAPCIVEIWVKNGLGSIREACRQLASRAIVDRGRRRGGRVIKRSLSRDIGAALAFKAVALTLIYLLFFSGSRAPVVTPSEMAGFLMNGRGESRH